MPPRYAAKVDNTQADIVTALRDAGAEVWILGQPVDLLVAFRGRWHVIEVKSGAKDAERKTSTAQRQREHMDRAAVAGCVIHVVWTPEMALEAIGAL